MKVVFGIVVLIRLVALGAEGVGGGMDLQRVGIVAIAATYSGVVHPALGERAVDIDLLLDLAVGMVERLFQDRGHVAVVEGAGSRGRGAALEEAAVGVAGSAGLDLDVGLQGSGAFGEAGFRIGKPSPGDRFLEPDREAHVTRVAGRVPVFREPLGPPGVLGSRPVAGLATHIHLRPLGCVGGGGGIEVFPEIGRVAVRAHVVPVEMQAGPVEQIIGRDFLVGIEVVPALPALVDRARVPANLERLEPPAFRRQEILLQRIDSEGVFDLPVLALPPPVLGIDPILPLPGEKPEDAPEMLELGIFKIPENGFRGGDRHGFVMVGFLPLGERLLVAIPA